MKLYKNIEFIISIVDYEIHSCERVLSETNDTISKIDKNDTEKVIHTLVKIGVINGQLLELNRVKDRLEVVLKHNPEE